MAKSTIGRITPLEWHLQTACELELWTIPLYLSAAFSIRTDKEAQNPGLAAAVQTELLSVAIQEMYHLQEACNIATTFGYKPKLKAPVYDKLPCIKENKAIKVEIGDAYEVIDLLIEIETPDEANDPPTTPPRPNKAGDYEYDSIGDLYNVMQNLAIKHWDDPEFVKARQTSYDREKAAPTFKGRYKFNKIKTVWDLQNSISAIVDQGEGMRHDSAKPNMIDPRVPKAYWPKNGSRFYDYDELSHYERFIHAKIRMYSDETYDPTNANSKLVDVYPLIEKPTAAQKKQQAEAHYNLNLFHSQFLQSMRDAWAHAVDPQPSPRWTTDDKYKGVFLDNFFQSMNFMKQLIIQVWETGAVPEFKEIHFEQEAFWSLFEKLDKYDNYHQSKEDGNLATIHFGENDQYKFHACQGLNMCKGMGHNGSGSQPGDGDCATVVPHNCSQGNDCKYQGGCAFAPYAAIDNTCRMQGGCQTPISQVQVMAGGSSSGSLVWDVARQQLAGRLNKNVKDLPAIQVNDRRQNVRPSNPKKA